MGGKNFLVVGGTKGIGSGIAVALAEAGASVHLVGRDRAAADKTLGKMRVAQESAGLSSAANSFHFHVADLATVRGCIALAATLAADSKDKFDGVIMTLGAWPDWCNPR